jgi:hypothetical protein
MGEAAQQGNTFGHQNWFHSYEGSRITLLLAGTGFLKCISVFYTTFYAMPEAAASTMCTSCADALATTPTKL